MYKLGENNASFGGLTSLENHFCSLDNTYRPDRMLGE